MRILFVVPYIPNLIRVRSYNLIRSLHQRGHQVTLASLITTPADQQDLPALQALCERVIAVPLPTWRSLLNSIRAMPGKQPMQMNYCWDARLDRQIRDAVISIPNLTSFDVIHIEHLRAARYGLSLKAAMPPRKPIPIVWDSVDCISYLFDQAVRKQAGGLRKSILQADLSRTKRYEGYLVPQFEQVLVTSRVDQEELSKLVPEGAGTKNITVVPNGVDLDYFRPDTSIRRDPDSLVISGKMSYHANIAMVNFLMKKIMPLVWNTRPNVTVKIVGKDPPGEIRALARDPRITVTGTVADIRPYLQQGALAVAPLAYGAGIQNKVLEALACATPTIISPQAASALEANPGTDLRVAEGELAFADQIITLLSDENLRRKMGQSGRAYVERCHRWSNITEQVETQYQLAIERRKEFHPDKLTVHFADSTRKEEWHGA